MQVQVISTVLPYHQLMTPIWLKMYSTINGNYTLHHQYLEFPKITRPPFQRILQVKLVAPGILYHYDQVAVTMTIAMDTKLADATDHDPSFGISDGSSFIGYQVVDKHNYGGITPCRHIEGKISSGQIKSLRYVKGLLVTSRAYSSEVTLQFRPTEQWGSCHTEHDTGFVNIANYNNKLNPNKGLYLQMYVEDDPEMYRIKYIVVDVRVD